MPVLNAKQHAAAQLGLSLVAGVLFAHGLALSQMVNPAKVLNFLDFFGSWDPTLAFVMGGALLVTVPAFRLILQQPQPLLAPKFVLPTKTDVDAPLLAGAAIFGVGWGMAGLCPGPAITALASGALPVAGFVVAMVAGMQLHKILFERDANSSSQ